MLINVKRIHHLCDNEKLFFPLPKLFADVFLFSARTKSCVRIIGCFFVRGDFFQLRSIDKKSAGKSDYNQKVMRLHLSTLMRIHWKCDGNDEKICNRILKVNQSMLIRLMCYKVDVRLIKRASSVLKFRSARSLTYLNNYNNLKYLISANQSN